MTTDLDALIAEAKRLVLIDRTSREPVVAMLSRATDALESTLTELRQERERAENGSCWDDGPQMRTPGGCDPMPPKCELRAGHLGAHRGGQAEWMRNPSSYRQVAKERDEALAALDLAADRNNDLSTALSRAEETIERVEDFVTRHYLDTQMGQKVLDAITEYDKQKGADRG